MTNEIKEPPPPIVVSGHQRTPEPMISLPLFPWIYYNIPLVRDASPPPPNE